MTNDKDVSNRRSLRSVLHDFFYKPEVPYTLALLRILLPSVLMLVVVPRWMHSRELYSTDGAACQLALNYGYPDFLPEPSGTLAVVLVTVLGLALISSAIGWFTRPSLVIAAVIYPYLNMLDCVSSMTKYSVISTHLLVLLALSDCGAIWSIDSLKRRAAQRRSVLGVETSLPLAPVWPRRLMQLLIALIYFGAATTKLQTDGYFTSDQLRWWMMTNVNRSNPIGEWLSLYPVVLVVMAYIAIVWQIVFVAICWKGVARLIAIGIGASFHTSTAPLLGLYLFPMVMISSYVIFFGERDVWRCARCLRRTGIGGLRVWNRLTRSLQGALSPVRVVIERWGASGLAYLLVLSSTAAVGVAAEHLLDPYGLRRASGPYELVPIDPAFMRSVEVNAPQIAETDKYLSFDIGTQLVGGVLVNSRDDFRPGEKLIVQASLTLLHGDIWAECNLHDAEGHVLESQGRVIPRELLRAEWHLKLPETLEAGDYDLVFKSSGQEIGRRRIRVSDRS